MTVHQGQVTAAEGDLAFTRAYMADYKPNSLLPIALAIAISSEAHCGAAGR